MRGTAKQQGTRSRFRVGCLYTLLLLLLAQPLRAVEYRPLPPPARTGLSNDWLIYFPQRNQLSLYLSDYHAPARAYYQWVSLRPGTPVRISFAARAELSLFLNNRLVFTAPTPGTYQLDLTRLLRPTDEAGRYLLCVWHPTTSPDYESFVNVQETPVLRPSGETPKPLQKPVERELGHQNVYIVFLLVLGLLYGSIRTAYQPGFSRIYQLSSFWSPSATEQDFLVKPTITWLNLALVLAFALSFALLLVAVHTSLQNVVLLQRLFNVAESTVVVRILVYTGLVALFVLLKYVYLHLMGYIFDVSALVTTQYREFVRTTLLLGLALPFVMLAYLALNAAAPQAVLWASNGVITFLLVGTVVRVGRTLHRKASLLNLHLFSYLCATEVIPLVILLKIIVFSY